MRISDWSSDVGSSDLGHSHRRGGVPGVPPPPISPVVLRSQVVVSGGRSVVGAGPRPRSMLLVPRGRGSENAPSGRGYERQTRSEGRRGGKECVSTCRHRWTREHEKKKKKRNTK